MNQMVPNILMKVIVGAAFITLTAACDMKSQVDIDASLKHLPVNPTVVTGNPLANHQGGAVTGETASGYKVSASLGAQIDSIKGTTTSGYEVRLNYPGQISR